MDPIWSFVVLPLAFGLLGFVEPCSIGSSLLFVKYVEGQPASVKLMQAGIFTLTRAVFIGMLGAIAAVVGTAFIGFQRAGWVVLGILYLALGFVYLTGESGRLARTLGLSLAPLSPHQGAATLAVAFGLNIPACAAPLLAAVFGAAALTQGARIGQGFAMLALFGLALSLPLLAALAWKPARQALDRLSVEASHVPRLTGLLLAALGLWSIYAGFFAKLVKVTP